MRLGKKDRPQPFLLPPSGIFHSQETKPQQCRGWEEMAIDHSYWSTPPPISAFLKSCILANFSTNKLWPKARGAQQKKGQDAQPSKALAGSSAQPGLSSAKETRWHSPPSAPTAKGCFN